MSEQHFHELVVGYDPEPTMARIARAKGWVRSRVIGFGISIVIVVVIAVWQREALSTTGTIVGCSLAVLVGLAAIAVTYLLYRRTRRPLASLGEGTALRIDRRGVELAGHAADWSEITGFAVRRGPLGLSPEIELTRTSSPPTRLPLDQLAVLPATIDSVARAHSGGRRGLDLSDLDN